MANLKISQLTELSETDGTEYTEVIISPYTTGTNRKVLTSKLGITYEFNRAFATELLFDKNEIEYQSHELSGNLTFTLAGSGHLSNRFASLISAITFDGTQSVNFGSGIIPFGITNGGIPDAGTYYIMFLYWNGIALAHFMTPSIQVATGLQLLAPPNLVAVADGQTAIDLTWDDVANEESYLIEWSTTGTGGWAILDTPAAGVTSSTQTGLSANTTRFYRAKAIGDGINFLDSPYSTANATTADAGDVTAPTFVFYPLNGTSAHRVNEMATITPDEDCFDATTGAAINDANAADYVTCKETNSGGADIPVVVTYDGVFRVTPVTSFGQTQVVYLAVHDVRDVNGNVIAGPISITFTTTEYTLFNGTSNRSTFGDILDDVFGADNTNFWVELSVKDPVRSGTKFLVSKWQSPTSNRCFYFLSVDTDVYFVYYMTVGVEPHRGIKWTGAMPSGESTLVVKYDGSIDTNDGLDRVVLEVDGVVQGSKSIASQAGALTGLLGNAASHLAVGIATNALGTPSHSGFYTGEAKDFIIRSAGGTVVEINIPDLAAAIDISGNARHGTFT